MIIGELPNTSAEPLEDSLLEDDELTAAVSETTAEILRRRRRNTTRRGRLVPRMLLVADVVGLVSAMLLAEWLVTIHAPGALEPRTEILLFLASVPAWIVVARLYGLYARDEENTDHSTADDLVGVFHMVTVCTSAFGVSAWLTGLAHPQPSKLVLFWLFAIVLISLGRGAARAIARRRIMYLQNAVIVGAGDVGQLVARKLQLHREYGINVVGFVDRNPKEQQVDLSDLPILGGPERLKSIIRLFDVERVIVAFSNESHEDMLALVASLRDLDVQVDIVPRLFEAVGPRAAIHTLEGLPLVGLRPLRTSRSSLFLKRLLDIAVSLSMVTFFLPVFAIVALLIRLTSRGPVIYSDERVGRNGEFFRAFKFRTMYLDYCRGQKFGAEPAERAFECILGDPSAREEFDRTRKLTHDPRVTRVGRLLRRTSLDELPQFINALRGDVSLVGPRPITRFELERYGANGCSADGKSSMGYWNFNIRPGLTGYWQINGRSSMDYSDRVRLDLVYSTNWSLSLDLMILAKTARVLASRRGAL